MKVSLNWLKQFVDFDLPSVDELVDRIGAQLGAVEAVEDLGQKYQGVVVAKVVECVEHPDSDHMHVCKIDDGGHTLSVERDERGLVQVVCGAPNVREGLTVAWLPPGVTVPESVGKEPFVLGQRALRGVMSNGMLASPRELALGDSHEGILVIDKAVEPGTPFVEVYKLDDHVIDIENKMFTHRPDCFGVLGVAREVAGILGHQFTSPDWYRREATLPGKTADLPLTVSNELPELVPRFSAITLSDVAIGLSPLWLQVALLKVGQKPISNIVDLTNFYMLVTGQPLHAYDYDKVRAITGGETAAITVRYPKPGEKIKLINGKEIEPRSEAIMITSGDRLIGVGGVMGGYDTEVDAGTRNIILEAASFDMYNIRRSSMAHGLFTDAVTRFNKGQSPLQTVAVLAKIVADVQHLAGASVASDLIDVTQLGDRQWVHPPVPVTADFVNARLGLELSADDMKKLLENVEFKVDLDGELLTVTAPFWRTDIEQREDVVEEVGRLYGFDKLPLELPRRDITPATRNIGFDLHAKIRDSLSRAGANELLTYSFVHGKLLDKVSQKRAQAFTVANALSPDLQYYRLHALPSLLDKVHLNIKAGFDQFALFELNVGHNLMHKDDAEGGVPTEIAFLDFVYAAKQPLAGAPFYVARRYLDALAKDLGLELTYASIAEDPNVPVADPYDHHRAAYVSIKNGPMLGMVGEFKPGVLRNLKLPAYSAGFTIGPDQLAEALQTTISQYQPLPRFPKVEQDICLKVAADVSYSELADFAAEQLQTLKPADSLLQLAPWDIYQREDDTEHRQITFRIGLASYDKTLTDAEMNQLLDQLTIAAHAKFGAERI